MLLVSLRALQVPADQVSIVQAFAAWSLARLLGSIPITPGGIGVVELSLTGTLVGFGGNNAGVVAAVLVYRFLTMVPTLVLGLIAASDAAPPRACRDPGLGSGAPRRRLATAIPDRRSDAMAMDDGSMGGRTWIKFFAILLGVAVAAILVLGLHRELDREVGLLRRLPRDRRRAPARRVALRQARGEEERRVGNLIGVPRSGRR